MVVPATVDDLDAIMSLESAGFEAAEQWSETSWRDELSAPGRTVLLACDERVVGAIALNAVGESADLQRIVVDPSVRRSGVANRLVHAGLEAVRRSGVRSVILEVCYDNEPAIALYQRLGFEQLGVRENYYGSGRHALILKLYADSMEREMTVVADD
ncbi:GNAT family N-acetyltransferase [Microlunatus panaciterrae]|nr:GNAT family N-acetyltransferase [Microlunatus panaciterrae]